MKRYQIVHNTTYAFSAPVTLLPHTLRLRPREGHELRIESSKLDITPAATLRWHRDVEGNSVAVASFVESTNILVISSDITIQQYDQAPHDFLVADYAVGFPFRYLEQDLAVLQPYMNPSKSEENTQLKRWVDGFYHPGEVIQSFALLLRLNQLIYRNFVYGMREEAGVQTVSQTLSSGSGSCRDFAHLYMMAARKLGFAARFVSGYIYDNSAASLSGATHAWAEVFIPGAGWKGFDPTFGKIVGAEHITVAVARLSESIPPVAGSFLGGATADMRVDVRVTELQQHL